MSEARSRIIRESMELNTATSTCVSDTYSGYLYKILCRSASNGHRPKQSKAKHSSANRFTQLHICDITRNALNSSTSLRPVPTPNMANIPKLPTRKLGKNGPEVTAIGFGTMGLSAFYGKPKPDEERYALLDHIYQSGELFWDTADMYGDSEDLLGRWFKRNPGAREKIFLATKFANYQDPKTGERSVRNEPEYIREACERSLKRLGVDHIDLYYCHRLQADQPIEITVKVMKELQDAGKVKYLGLSECSADSLRRACKVRTSENNNICMSVVQ